MFNKFKSWKIYQLRLNWINIIIKFKAWMNSKINRRLFFRQMFWIWEIHLKSSKKICSCMNKKRMNKEETTGCWFPVMTKGIPAMKIQ